MAVKMPNRAYARGASLPYSRSGDAREERAYADAMGIASVPFEMTARCKHRSPEDAARAAQFQYRGKASRVGVATLASAQMFETYAVAA